jgi:hypothetical protein
LFDCGANLQLRSNSFYQKFLKKSSDCTVSAPPQSGGYASSKIFFSFKNLKSGAGKN